MLLLHMLHLLIGLIHCLAKIDEQQDEDAVPRQQCRQVHQSHRVIPNRYPVCRRVVTDPESTKPLLPQPTY